jgi:hypothetical protein
MDDSTFPAVLDDVWGAVALLVCWVTTTPDLDLARAETETLHRVRAIGARLLEAGLAGRPEPAREVCACGQPLRATVQGGADGVPAGGPWRWWSRSGLVDT